MKKEYCLKFKELLENKEITKHLINTYVDTDKDRYEEGCANGYAYKIILYLDGSIDVIYQDLNSDLDLVLKGEALQVFFLDEQISISDTEMGDITEVEDYEDFITYLKNEYNEDWEDYVDDWSEYKEYNEDNFYAIEQEAWEELCEQYSYYEAENRINHLIEELI